LGLVPRQHTTGGRTRLKRGNQSDNQHFHFLPKVGGLMAYGPDLASMYKQATRTHLKIV
jgi:hypothetical protein